MEEELVQAKILVDKKVTNKVECPIYQFLQHTALADIVVICRCEKEHFDFNNVYREKWTADGNFDFSRCPYLKYRFA